MRIRVGFVADLFLSLAGPGEKAIETLGPSAHVLAQRYKSDVYAFNIRGSEINITGVSVKLMIFRALTM